MCTGEIINRMIINTDLLQGKEFEYLEESHIVIKEGRIQEIEEGHVREESSLDFKEYVALPAFFNAHTHIGDSFAQEAACGCKVSEAVGREGIKWDLYDKECENSIREGIRDSTKFMLESGTIGFADFREGSKKGVRILRESLDNDMKCLVLGRGLDPIEEDIEGLGLNIHNLSDISKEKKRNWLLGIHAGEHEKEVSKALEYRPDFIVHATLSTEDEIKELGETSTDVVICPRSNAALKVGFPPVRELLDEGLRVGLGTDNVMVNSPSLFREMEYLYKSSQIHGELRPKEVLKMVTRDAFEMFGMESGLIQKNRNADLMFVRKDEFRFSKNPVATVVNRLQTQDVRAVMIDGRFMIKKDN